MSPAMIAALGVVVFLVLILLGMNIGLALLLVGFVGYAIVINPVAALTVLRTEPFTQGSSYAMIVIPLFIMMGNFAFRAGLSSSLYNAANKWLSRVPGNLAAASVAACGSLCPTPRTSWVVPWAAPPALCWR